MYIDLWRYLQRKKENRKIVKHGFKIFACRLKIYDFKWDQELKRKIQKFREDRAIRIIAKYWKKFKMTKKKFIKRVRKNRGGHYRYHGDGVRGSFAKDNVLSTKNSEKDQNASENGISRKHSIRKKPTLLPNLPMSPTKLKNKAMMFLIKPKKVLKQKIEKSKSSAVRLSVQGKEIPVTFPKLNN